ncbi:hypothetical protein [Sporomusa aerivorans]|uniref:capsular polysaccharide export protein, LipB/KpsS family n=1 Tax=Sporomusa aerivorans TaxID=204936 RepID=UPI00352A2E32
MKKRNILFIFLSNVQYEYFKRLGDYLSNEYNVHYLRLKEPINLKDVIKTASLSSNVKINDIDQADIIEYSVKLKKYSKKLSMRRKFLMNTSFLKKHTVSLAMIVKNYLEVHSIDLVCVWNGSKLPLAVSRYIAKLMGIHLLHFENGALLDTTTVDSIGVNFHNSLVDMPVTFWESVSIDEEKIQSLCSNPLTVRERRNTSSVSGFFLKIKEDKTCNIAVLPNNYIFVPFQVHDDTQVLLFSPQVKTMEQLLDFVWQAVEKFNQNSESPLTIVVKEHPGDYGRIDYTKLREQYHERNVIFANECLTEDLIKNSTGVITLNSTVGIEALLCHKPVISLGNAFYNIPGLVTNVANPDKLADYLYVLDRPVNINLANKFLYYLRYKYLVEGSWRNPDERHLESVKKKVENVLDA